MRTAPEKKSTVLTLAASISLLLSGPLHDAAAQETVHARRPSIPYRAWYSFDGYDKAPEMYTNATMTLGGGPDARLLEEVGKTGLSWGYGTQIKGNAESERWLNYCGPSRRKKAEKKYSYNFISAGTALDEWLYRADFPEIYGRIEEGLKAGKAANPDAFIPVWLIDAARPELHNIGREGYGDLLVVEGYTHTTQRGLGVAWEQALARMEELENRGLGRKTIFGFGHITDKLGWNGNEWTEALLRSRMEDVRLRYPNSPGIAFFGGGIGSFEAYRPLATLIDQLTKEYWPELPIRNGVYSLTPQNATQTRMDAANSGKTNGTKVLMATGIASYQSVNQKWRFTHLGGNIYRITPCYTSAVSLEVSGAGNGDGNAVHLYVTRNNKAQLWRLEAATGGYKLSPLSAPGTYLRAPSVLSGAQLQIWSKRDEAGQVWAINPEVSAADPAEPVYQAEDATLEGSASIDKGAWVGSTGKGAAKTGKEGNITWTGIDGGTGGVKTLIFRYTVATSDRSVKLTVNGSTSRITFPKTASWRTYENVRVLQELKPGENNTIVISPGSDESPTIDNLAVADASVMKEDWEAPTAPTDLRVFGSTPTTVSLSWKGSTDNVAVTGYEIYRDGRKVATVTGTSYKDTGLTGNTDYTYYVKAIDAAWHMSPITPKVIGKTGRTTVGR